MTVIAWDGTTLAADRLAVSGSFCYPVTKIKRFNGELLFASGAFDTVHALYRWYECGADPRAIPDCQGEKEDWEALHVIRADGSLWRYERSLSPWLIEAPMYATGTGRDYAIAAMHCGKTAQQAVEIACLYAPDCGMGVDVLKLK